MENGGRRLEMSAAASEEGPALPCNDFRFYQEAPAIASGHSVQESDITSPYAKKTPIMVDAQEKDNLDSRK